MSKLKEFRKLNLELAELYKPKSPTMSDHFLKIARELNASDVISDKDLHFARVEISNLKSKNL